MKRTRSAARAALLLGALGLTAAGCNDLLVEEPRGFTTTDTFYQTAADVSSGTRAVYNSLRGLQAFNIWYIIELASDQARADTRETNAGTYGPDLLDYDAATGATGNFWNIYYDMITRANLVIARAPGAGGNEAAKALNVAEAKFLRGYAYLFLTKLYDDVPLLLTPEEQANPRPTRTPVEEVQQAVIRDLTEAEAALPLTWPTSDAFGGPTAGRATKQAARMALADLHLWRSSFLKKDEWRQASDAAKRVMDAGVSRLNNDYFATFRPANRGNAELVFAIPNTGVDARTSHPLQLHYYPRDWGTDQWGGWGLLHPTNWFLNSFIAGDYRKDSGFLAGGCSGGGLCVTAFADGPMPRKYITKSDNGAIWSRGDFDVPLYRYAEAILTYAEAQNELGNAAEAIRAMNLIRERARRGTGSETRAQPANYAGATDRLAVRDAIYQERAWDLMFENKRWFDQVRRDGLEPGYWARSFRENDRNAERLRPLSEHKKRFPIPAGQIATNPALTQNPGY